MTRAEILKLRLLIAGRQHAPTKQVVFDIIDEYERLLALCRPHLEWLLDDGGLDEGDEVMIREFLAQKPEV